MTSKLQVTLPKALADQYSIKPGDEIEWEAAADIIHVIPPRLIPVPGRQRRLELFDLATQRQRQRERKRRRKRNDAVTRGWAREDLYDRGRLD